MKTLLVAVNATYSHTNLALRYLSAYCRGQFPDLDTVEFNINQDPGLMLADIARRRPDVVGFSCYLWNIELILPLVSNLRQICPETVIVLGGPEVSYDTDYWLNNYPAIDYLAAGEGEKAFLLLLETIRDKGKRIGVEQLTHIPGLVYRTGDGVKQNPQEPLDLAEIPPIYGGDLSDLKNKIVYYETTRGCPFRCAYCLSSVMGPVRKFPLERAKAELRNLASVGLQQVRFVDRTFNYDAKRAYELLEFMIELDTTTRFQLEVSGDILTEPVLELLKRAPENRFQFEIGVQSTHTPTLAAVERRSDLGRLREVVKFLMEETTVRVLLDLIAGLPQEGFERFGESFNYVYELKPQRIHLGFLKLLRGSRLREEADSFGCLYTERAPYEVLRTDHLSFAEIQRLKIIEDLVEKYCGGRFDKSLEYLLRDGKKPFDLFNAFAGKWEKAGYHWYNHSLSRLYQIIAEFFGEGNPDLVHWLRYDFRRTEPRRATPKWLGGRSDRKLENELISSGRIFAYLPELEGLQPREIGRKIFVEEIPFSTGTEVFLFYFSQEGEPARVFVLE